MSGEHPLTHWRDNPDRWGSVGVVNNYVDYNFDYYNYYM